jgi:hypothetical protein
MLSLLAACGDSNERPSSVGATTTTDAMGMTAEEMAQMTAPTTSPVVGLPVLADGTLDPDRVDLSGVEGVSLEQQKNAESLLRRTILSLRKWSDDSVAIEQGFEPIGDSLTGEEHYLHWDWIDDDVIFDPEHPEALVYKVTPTGGRELEAAMYILPDKYNLDNVPDVGGKLVQYHVHDDLCFTAPPAPQVAAVTSVGGSCHPPLVKFDPNVMIHVWSRPNSCGPFAALKGIGAGQIRPGDQRACDHQHGELGL